jgi:hypothetical protein
MINMIKKSYDVIHMNYPNNEKIKLDISFFNKECEYVN